MKTQFHGIRLGVVLLLASCANGAHSKPKATPAKMTSNTTPTQSQPKKPVPEPTVGHDQIIGAYIDKGNLVGINAKGRRVRRLQFKLDDETLLHAGATAGTLLVIRNTRVELVDWAKGALRPAFVFPTADFAPTEDGTVPRVMKMTRIAQGMCALVVRGDPTDGSDESYAEWTYQIDDKQKTVTRRQCEASAAGSPRIASSRPSLRLVQTKTRCGVELETGFFPMPRPFSQPSNCTIRVHTPWTKSHMVPVSVDLGVDDAMQKTFILFIFDIRAKRFIKVAERTPDMKVDSDYYGWSQTPIAQSVRYGLLLVQDLQSNEIVQEGLPWRRSMNAAMFWANEHFFQIRSSSVSAQKTPSPVAFF